jgi:hypothetical protein
MKPKLRRAFAALTKAGIKSRANFSISLSNGYSEIYETGYRGFAFYHSQDTAGARTSGSVNIAFGAFAKGAKHKDIIAIGRELKQALEAEGLFVDWDESAESRPTVHLSEKSKLREQTAASARIQRNRAAQETTRAALLKTDFDAKMIEATESLGYAWISSFCAHVKKEYARFEPGQIVLLLPFAEHAVIAFDKVTIFVRDHKGDLLRPSRPAALRAKQALKERGFTVSVRSGMVEIDVAAYAKTTTKTKRKRP